MFDGLFIMDLGDAIVDLVTLMVVEWISVGLKRVRQLTTCYIRMANVHYALLCRTVFKPI